MYIRDIINKKRNKGELDNEEIKFFIYNYFKGEILEEQAAALLTLMYTNGMSLKEMTYLAQTMAETGEEMELYRVAGKIVDIHTIGGISDKTVIIMLPILRALNIPACKLSGRELGIATKLESINGYKMEENIDELKKNLQESGIGIAKEPSNLAPIEEKLYKLRYNIACDNNMELIAISIMSQKLAVGCKNIIIEVTYGENAYVKTFADAKKLCKILVDIGKNVNRNVVCFISKLNHPLGRNSGAIIEIDEIVEALKGNIESDIKERILEFGSSILGITGIEKNVAKAKKKIIDVINSGEAYENFKEIIRNNNGDIEDLEKKHNAKNVVPVMANMSGYISEIDVNKIRMVCRYLDVIKKNINDDIDKEAGVSIVKKIGDKVRLGEIIAYVHTNEDNKITRAVAEVKDAFILSDKKVTKTNEFELKIG